MDSWCGQSSWPRQHRLRIPCCWKVRIIVQNNSNLLWSKYDVSQWSRYDNWFDPSVPETCSQSTTILFQFTKHSPCIRSEGLLRRSQISLFLWYYLSWWCWDTDCNDRVLMTHGSSPAAVSAEMVSWHCLLHSYHPHLIVSNQYLHD